MKSRHFHWSVSLLSAWTLSCFGAAPFDVPTHSDRRRTAEKPPTAGQHHCVWVEREIAAPAGSDLLDPGFYIELAAGLNRFDPEAQEWVPALAQVELTADGLVIARQPQHQVILSPTIETESTVDFLTPDGVRLRSTPLGRGALDTATGRSFLLADLQASALVLVAPDEVLYRNAFDGVQADPRSAKQHA